MWALPDGENGDNDELGDDAAAPRASLFAPPDVLIVRGENGSNHEVYRHVQTLTPLARALGVPIDKHLRYTSEAVAFLSEVRGEMRSSTRAPIAIGAGTFEAAGAGEEERVRAL